MDETPRANRLIHETSPYLLQHAHNPVDWYPWGEEALQRARAEDRPIVLSVGYSACHWCHVMAHESFEDAATAAVMNEYFVNIKVDREERPDVDAIYMEAVQALTGQGGWPMTVFLQPDGLPFYGGTYFPPADRHGLPAFRRVLLAVAESYRERRDQIRESAAELRAHLGGQLAASATGEPNVQVLDEAVRNLGAAFDEVHGGLGGAPKFPQPSHWEFLLRAYHRTGDPQALAMVEKTLLAMAHGGIYDQLGGGFHRYAVDERWLVPHFEKMLYDNAQLATLYLHAYQVTGNAVYRTVVEETLDYVAREMTAPDGGFYSSQDADSEGHEGRFFVWNLDEARAVLAGAGLDEQDARLVLDHYGITARGKFEGQNILSVPREPATAGVARSHLDEAVARGRQALFAARETRVRPGRDDKILTAWNGLMLRAFAEAGAVLGRDDYRRLARRNAAFLLEQMRDSNGRLRRVFKDGTARLNGYLEDYAFLADGLLALYVATFELPYYRAARELAGAMVDHFWDAEEPGFYTTSDDHEALILRPRAMLDNAVPAGSSVAVEVLLRLAAYTGDERFAAPVEAVLRALAVPLGRYPAALSRLLGALESYAAPPPEIALIGDPEDPALQRLAGEVYRRFEPAAAVALARGPHDAAVDEIPLLAGRTAIDGRAAAYVCRHFTCLRPATTPQQLAEQLEAGQ